MTKLSNHCEKDKDDTTNKNLQMLKNDGKVCKIHLFNS